MSRARRFDLRTSLWLSRADAATLAVRAEKVGLSRADYIRRAALDLRLRPRESAAKIAAANKIGGNLNQAVRALNMLAAQARSKREREAVMAAAEAVMAAAHDVRQVVADLRAEGGRRE